MLHQRKKAFAKNQSYLSRSRPSSRPSASDSITAKLLDVIGIRPVSNNPPLTKSQKAVLRFDLIVALLIFVIALATRLYRINIPPSIGMFTNISFSPLSPHSLSIRIAHEQFTH